MPRLPAALSPTCRAGLASLAVACTPAPAPVHTLAPPAPGWGAVLWEGGTAYAYGPGAAVLGLRDAAARVDAPGVAAQRCGGIALQSPPAGAALVLPPGAAVPTITPPPANAAPLVEAVSFRLDAHLPAADRFTPIDPAAQPAKQRGLELGSVIKVRRTGNPPVLLATGRRGCTAVLALLDREASRIEATLDLPGLCETPRLVPPADYDGDGAREAALATPGRVVAFRLDERSPTPALQLLGDWSCPAPTP